MENTYREFIVMPEKSRWISINGYRPNIVFAQIRNWFSLGTKIAVMDVENEQCFIYTVD